MPGLTSVAGGFGVMVTPVATAPAAALTAPTARTATAAAASVSFLGEIKSRSLLLRSLVRIGASSGVRFARPPGVGNHAASALDPGFSGGPHRVLRLDGNPPETGRSQADHGPIRRYLPTSLATASGGTAAYGLGVAVGYCAVD